MNFLGTVKGVYELVTQKTNRHGDATSVVYLNISGGGCAEDRIRDFVSYFSVRKTCLRRDRIAHNRCRKVVSFKIEAGYLSAGKTRTIFLSALYKYTCLKVFTSYPAV